MGLAAVVWADVSGASVPAVVAAVVTSEFAMTDMAVSNGSTLTVELGAVVGCVSAAVVCSKLPTAEMAETRLDTSTLEVAAVVSDNANQRTTLTVCTKL